MLVKNNPRDSCLLSMKRQAQAKKQQKQTLQAYHEYFANVQHASDTSRSAGDEIGSHGFS